MFGDIQFKAARERILGDRIQIWFYQRHPSSVSVAEPMIMKDTPIEIEPAPAAIITPTTAQQMMDELWNIGVRPSEGSGSAGQLASVKYHLEDMRKLVFKT